MTADVFECRDALGNRYSVLSVVCMGTLYHCAWVVAEGGGTPSSLKCAEVFRDGWLQFGPPRFMTVDRGVHNRGQFAALMSSQGTYLRYAGTEAHHQIGRAERQGSILKEMIAHTVQGRHVVGSQMMRMVVTECAFVKNNRVNHGGFSPSQWVLGRLPEEVCSLTAERSEGELGVHQEILSGEHQFAQQLNIRQAAKESFAHVDSSNRVRSALMRRSTPCRGPYFPGDLLCFFRNKKWFGPARMIGREGRSNLWLIHGGIPIVVAEESVRPALAGEVLAKQITELRPSRKRKRQITQDFDPDLPFFDDLNVLEDEAGHDGDDGSGSGPGSYFHLGRGGGDGLPPGLSSDQPPQAGSQPAQPEPFPDDANEYSPGTPVAEEDTTMQPEALPDGLSPDGTSQPPPGLEAVPSESPGLATELPGLAAMPPPLHPPTAGINTDLPAVPYDDFDELMQEALSPDQPQQQEAETRGRLPTVSEIEPDQEMVPDTPAVNTPAPNTPREPTVTQLQEAMRRSVNALDGHPRRNRSRSPPRAMFSTQNEKQKQQGSTLHGFMGRRAPKKNIQRKLEKELNYNRAADDLKGRIDEARTKEWNNWLGFDACEVIPPEKAQQFLQKNPGVQVVPTRWVDINKARQGDPEHLKSRLVVRGDLERSAQNGEVRTDSPTASHLMLSVLLTFASCHSLMLHCGDITAAFLQGLGLARVLIMSLLKDGVPGVPAGSLLVAKKPVYGTKDAPRGFWRSLRKTMLAAGFRPVPHERAAYVLNTPDGKIDGLCICHVDDLLWCGGQQTQDAMKFVQEKLKFGKVEDTTFRYCGRTIAQTDEGIVVQCPHGLEKTRPVMMSTGRKRDRAAPATPEEQAQLRSVLGSLNWIVRVCRPDLAYDTNRLQTCVQKPVVQDLIDANSLLRRAQMTKDQKLVYGWKQFDFDKLEIMSITDASHAADFALSASGEKMGYRSQSGRLLAVGGPEVMTSGRGHIHLLEWKSQVIRRVCRSTLQAESLSMLTGYEDAEHLRMVLHGLRVPHDPRSSAWQIDSKDAIKLHKVTDCRSLQDHLLHSSGGEVQDKRLAIDLCGMRQVVWRENGEEFGDPMMNESVPADGTTKVRWCDTKTMLADGLTKHMDTTELRAVMSGREITMEFTFHAKRKTDVKTDQHTCHVRTNVGHQGTDEHGMET